MLMKYYEDLQTKFSTESIPVENITELDDQIVQPLNDSSRWLLHTNWRFGRKASIRGCIQKFPD